MKCETALTEGRGQAFSLHLPLTVPVFMRLTFARWKGPENQGGKENIARSRAGAALGGGSCTAVLGWVRLGCSSIPASPPALPRGDPFTSRQLSGCLPLPAPPLPARCAQPGSLPGKPWPSCPCLLHGRAGSTAGSPSSCCCCCASPGVCVVKGVMGMVRPRGRSLSCPSLGYTVPQGLLQAGVSMCEKFQGLG